jgi:hypothetical protein
MPDNVLDTSDWFSILMVGKGCKYLCQQDLEDLRQEYHVYQQWPRYGAAVTRYMHQITPLLWVINEALMDQGDLHWIDPYVVTVPKEQDNA